MKWRTYVPWWERSQERWVERFIIWPRRCEDGMTRCLCRVRVREEALNTWDGMYVAREYYPIYDLISEQLAR